MSGAELNYQVVVEAVKDVRLRSEGPDGGESVEGSGDVGEDGTASGGLETLKLASASGVEVAEQEEEGRGWGRWRGGRADEERRRRRRGRGSADSPGGSRRKQSWEGSP